MKKETLCLDTSVPSAYYDERDKAIQKETVYFFDKKLNGYETYISEMTIEELRKTKNGYKPIGIVSPQEI